MNTTTVIYESIDAKELARRWSVPKSWVEKNSARWYTDDPIPHVKLGRYTRYEWASPKLLEWWDRKRK